LFVSYTGLYVSNYWLVIEEYNIILNINSNGTEHVDVDELTRETALYVLTQIIELPILDGILAVIASAAYTSTAAADTETSTTLGNVGALKRYRSMCSILNESR